MTQAVIKLVKGARSLDLMTEPYHVGTDFRPPSTSYTTGLAGGGSANITGGAQVYAKKYVNQEFSFQIRLTSTSDGGIGDALRGLSSFLALAGDEDDPLYLHYKANSDTPEPLWGQYGANYRYEIVDGTISGMWDSYGLTALRARTVFVTVQLTIKPFAFGKQQRMATATGGILEDVIGTTDGRSRGVYLPEATVNAFANPVFGYSIAHTEWDYGWTAGASITAACNQQIDYVLPGTINSTYLTSSASTVNTYTQQVNMATTCWVTISCYAKLADSGSIGASHLSIYYGSTGSRTTTYASAGGGWYRLTASSLTGLNAACATGVMILKNKAVYVGGFQIEQKAYATPLVWGDMPGATWTTGASTANNSTSTRAAASCKIPIDNTVATSGQGSLRMIVKFDPAAGRGATQVLADLRDASHLTAPYLYYNASDTKFYFVSNAAAESSSTSSQTISYATFVLHATWGPAGLAVYLNGSTTTISATYTANALGANLFIGTDYTGANPLAGTIMGCATFDRALTAAEVSNDYATLAPIVAQRKRIEALPYFWTDDGDNVLSLNTGQQPLGMVQGVPGDAPAITEIQGNLSSNWTIIKSVFMSNYVRDAYVPWAVLFGNTSGCAGSASEYGGDHELYTPSITASPTTPAGGGIYIPLGYGRHLNGGEFVMLQRAKYSYAGVVLNFWGGYHEDYTYTDGFDTVAFSEARTIISSASYRTYHTRPFIISYHDQSFVDLGYYKGAYDMVVLSSLGLITGTASSFSACIDYQAMLPRPYVILGASNMKNSFSNFVYRGDRSAVLGNQRELNRPLDQVGDRIELEPDKYNHLQVYFGALENVDPALTYSCSIHSMYLTPRWLLM